MNSITNPLSGVRVLDLSRVLAGPLCTMMLADLGAGVIKVERPELGDDTRGWGPPFDENGQSAYFLSVNRNKLSLAADLRQPADLELLRELIAGADVVVDNFLPGVLSRFGLDRVQMLAQHEHLRWCTITGFETQPDRPGYDFIVQAESGWMAITGAAEGGPSKVGVALADVIAGKDAAIAILAALAARTSLSAHQRALTVSLSGSAAAALVNVAQNALVSGSDARRWGNAHPNLVPYQLFQARDRALVIAVGTDDQWKVCASALGLHAQASDDRLATNAGRVAHRELVVGAIQSRLETEDAARWMELLTSAGVPCGVVRSVLETLDGSDASPLTGMPSAVGGEIRYLPPFLDEHGKLVRRHHWSAFDHMPILSSKGV